MVRRGRVKCKEREGRGKEREAKGKERVMRGRVRVRRERVRRGRVRVRRERERVRRGREERGCRKMFYYERLPVTHGCHGKDTSLMKCGNCTTSLA